MKDFIINLKKQGLLIYWNFLNIRHFGYFEHIYFKLLSNFIEIKASILSSKVYLLIRSEIAHINTEKRDIKFYIFILFVHIVFLMEISYWNIQNFNWTNWKFFPTYLKNYKNDFNTLNRKKWSPNFFFSSKKVLQIWKFFACITASLWTNISIWGFFTKFFLWWEFVDY